MPSMTRICVGVSIIVGTFLGGMILMIDSITSGYFDVGLILFYTLGLPFIGMIIAIPIMITCVQSGSRTTSGRTITIAASQPATQVGPVPAATYVYEPPTSCPDCGGKLTSANVDWVGPLTLKCPYCGSTVQALKRQV
jgi:hypothetical protein